MNSALSISKSGLKGLQTNLDVTSNNIANVNTIGFKEKNANFQELLRNDVISENRGIANGISRGTKITQGQNNNKQGSLISSNHPFDLAISGEGFFGIRLPNNQLAYSRDGSFRFDSEGTLRNSAGNTVEIALSVPKNDWPEGIPSINEKGMVSVAGMPVGEIPIFSGDLSEQLIDIGNNQYVLPNGRIAERLDNPEINQFYLESSNVNLADSMSEMILTQRAYSMNTKVLQSTDEMMQRINEFKQ